MSQHCVYSSCPESDANKFTNKHARKIPYGEAVTFGSSLDPPYAPNQITGGWPRIPGKHCCRLSLPRALYRDLLLFIIRVRLLDGMDLISDIIQLLIGFKQPLGCRLICRGHSSALQLEQNLRHVPLEMEGGSEGCEESA